MELPSNEAVEGAAHGLFLDADIKAPTELTDEQKERIKNDPKIQKLTEKNKELTQAIKALGFHSICAAAGKTSLYEEKKEALNKLNNEKQSLRQKLKTNARDRHFRNADTEEFNRQCGGSGAGVGKPMEPPPAPALQIPERREFVELARQSSAELTEDERFKQRLICITLWVNLQRRKEPQRRGRHKKQQSRKAVPTHASSLREIEEREETVPEKLDPTWCPFCVCDTSLPPAERKRPWKKRDGKPNKNKLWNHVEVNVHRTELEAYSSGEKECGICRERGISSVPSNVMEFKSHTFYVHGVELRA